MAKRFRGLFGCRKLDRELDEELRFHLQERTRENIAAGMTPEQARLAARLRLGNSEAVKESTREIWTLVPLERFWQDMRYAARTLAKTPGFTLVAILTLALGIGANAVIFSVVDAVFLRPLPYKDASRLVTFNQPPIGKQVLGHPHKRLLAAWQWRTWPKLAHTIEFPSAYKAGTIDFSDARGRPERVRLAEVSPNFFALFGLRVRIGHLFSDAPSDERLAELSYGFWQTRYAGSPSVLGKTIELNGKPFTIAGVLPPGPTFPDKAQVWTPLPSTPSARIFTGNMIFAPDQIARLTPGATLAQAREELLRIDRRIASRSRSSRPTSVDVRYLRAQVMGSTRVPLLLLFAAVGLLLLIACANVAHLLLARGSGRFQELALRSALGATRGRLVAQLLAESLMLSLAGAALGLLCAWPGIALARSVTPMSPLLVQGIALHWRVVGFALVVALIAEILSGVLPALVVSRTAPGAALKSVLPGTLSAVRSRSAGRLHNLLGVTEIALACVLTIGALLLVHSFWKLMNVDLGFHTSDLVTTQVSLSGPAYKTGENRLTFYHEVLRRVRALPGVQGAAFVNDLPLAGPGTFSISLHPEGNASTAARVGVRHRPLLITASKGYFHTLGIPLLAGRHFDSEDTPTSPPVAVVSRSTAREYWPGEDPVGKTFTIAGLKTQPIEVIGMVADTRFQLAGKTKPTIYLPVAQQPIDQAALVVRTAGRPLAVTSALREVMRKVDAGEPLSQFQTMGHLISLSLAQPRFRTLLLGLFAGLALALAVLGVYGVLSHSVSRRVHEIGIRLTLGAEPGEVLRMVLREAAWLALAGVGIGMAGAVALTRLLRGMLFGVAPLDPFTFALVPALIVAVALASSFIPAWRAARVDPLIALRYE